MVPPYFFRRPLLLLLAAFASGLVWLRGWLPPSPSAEDPAHWADGTEVAVRGRVAGDPDLHADRFRFVLRAKFLRRDGASLPVDGFVRATVHDPAFSPGWGDLVELSGPLEIPPAATVPGGFDYRAYLAEKNVHAVITVMPGGWRKLRPAGAFSPFRFLGDLRGRVLATFDRRLGPHAAAILSGVLLGKKPGAFPAMEEDFRRSGTYHLLVASGSNVGFVLALWFFLARWALFLPRRAVWAGAAVCAFAYAGVAGADPPVLRAALMSALGVAAYLLGREDRVEHAVGFSMLALLLWRPRSLFEAGFQMSFAATFGVVMAVPALESALLRPADGEPSRWAAPARWTLRLFLVSAAAQFALLPLLVHYFHRLNWVGLVSNMVAVPLAALGLAFGIALAAADGALPAGAASLLAGAAERCALALWDAVRWFAAWPGAERIVTLSPGRTALLGGLVAATLVVCAARFRGARRLAFGWLVALPVLLSGGAAREPGLSLSWLDVGAGDCVVAVSPGGWVTVVDGGDEEAGEFRLVPYLRARGVKRVDRLVLTHGDPPHASGLAALLKEFPVGEFLCHPAAWRDRTWSGVREAVERAGVRRRLVEHDDAWEDDGARWRVVWPPRAARGDADDLSLALAVEYGATAALLTSDLPAAAQARLAASMPDRVDVLQWPHHGSRRPDFDFLAAASPRWIVVSGDAPLPAVRSFALGAPVLATAEHGTLEWRSDGRRSRLKAPRPPPAAVFRAFPRPPDGG